MLILDGCDSDLTELAKRKRRKVDPLIEDIRKAHKLTGEGNKALRIDDSAGVREVTQRMIDFLEQKVVQSSQCRSPCNPGLQAKVVGMCLEVNRLHGVD